VEILSDSSSFSICSSDSFSNDDTISEDNESSEEEVEEDDDHKTLLSNRQEEEINSNNTISDSDNDENSTLTISTQSFDQLLSAVMGKLNLDIDFSESALSAIHEFVEDQCRLSFQTICPGNSSDWLVLLI